MAVIYFVVGVALGNVMGATHDFTYRSVHAHINLLGWVSMLGVGLMLRIYADQMRSSLARFQFWLHQLAMPVMIVSLAAVVKGNQAFGPALGLASLAFGISAVLLMVNVWVSLRRAD